MKKKIICGFVVALFMFSSTCFAGFPEDHAVQVNKLNAAIAKMYTNMNKVCTLDYAEVNLTALNEEANAANPRLISVSNYNNVNAQKAGVQPWLYNKTIDGVRKDAYWNLLEVEGAQPGVEGVLTDAMAAYNANDLTNANNLLASATATISTMQSRLGASDTAIIIAAGNFGQAAGTWNYFNDPICEDVAVFPAG